MAQESHRNVAIAIVILTFNQKEKTLACLGSLREVTNSEFETVVWDNGSHDGTVDAIKEAFPSVLVHYHPENLGVAGGRNEAARLAIERFSPELMLFLDNDTIVAGDFLEPLCEPFHDDPAVAQTSPKLLLLKDPERIDMAGGANIAFWKGNTAAVGRGELDRGQYDESRIVIPGGLMMVRTDVFRRLGGFDTSYNPYGYEDLDFSLRARESGYHGRYVPRSVIYHDPSQTFEGGKFTKTYAAHKVKTYLMFMRRHASPSQRALFYLAGIPYILVRALWREARKGNAGAVAGLFRGVFRA